MVAAHRAPILSVPAVTENLHIAHRSGSPTEPPTDALNDRDTHVPHPRPRVLRLKQKLCRGVVSDLILVELASDQYIHTYNPEGPL